MVITTWVINLAPVGVFFLIGGQVRLNMNYENCTADENNIAATNKNIF